LGAVQEARVHGHMQTIPPGSSQSAEKEVVTVDLVAPEN
jgi:hypothetical protein